MEDGDSVSTMTAVITRRRYVEESDDFEYSGDTTELDKSILGKAEDYVLSTHKSFEGLVQQATVFSQTEIDGIIRATQQSVERARSTLEGLVVRSKSMEEPLVAPTAAVASTSSTFADTFRMLSSCDLTRNMAAESTGATLPTGNSNAEAVITQVKSILIEEMGSRDEDDAVAANGKQRKRFMVSSDDGVFEVTRETEPKSCNMARVGSMDRANTKDRLGPVTRQSGTYTTDDEGLEERMPPSFSQRRSSVDSSSETSFDYDDSLSESYNSTFSTAMDQTSQIHLAFSLPPHLRPRYHLAKKPVDRVGRDYVSSTSSGDLMDTNDLEGETKNVPKVTGPTRIQGTVAGDIVATKAFRRAAKANQKRSWDTKATSSLQRKWRSLTTCHKESRNSSLVQRLWRSKLSSIRDCHAAITLQRAWQGRRVHLDYLKLKESASKIQAFVRFHCLSNRASYIVEMQKKSANLGFRYCRTVDAVRKIQAIWTTKFRHRAASKIQTQWVQHRDRQALLTSMARIRAAATTIQSSWRGHRLRSQCTSLQAGCSLLRVLRKLKRSHLHGNTGPVNLFNAIRGHWPSSLFEKRLRIFHVSIAQKTSLIRLRSVTGILLRHVRATVTLQRVVRGYLSRERHVLERLYLIRFRRERARLVRKIRRRMATKIQAVWRGHSVRVPFATVSRQIYEDLFRSGNHIEVTLEFEQSTCMQRYLYLIEESRKQLQASTKLQNSWRAYVCRENYRYCLACIKKIQRFVRLVRWGMEYKAATKIQSLVRGNVVRCGYNYLHRCVRLIQATFRMHRAKSHFLRIASLHQALCAAADDRSVSPMRSPRRKSLSPCRRLKMAYSEPLELQASLPTEKPPVRSKDTSVLESRRPSPKRVRVISPTLDEKPRGREPVRRRHSSPRRKRSPRKSSSKQNKEEAPMVSVTRKPEEDAGSFFRMVGLTLAFLLFLSSLSTQLMAP